MVRGVRGTAEQPVVNDNHQHQSIPSTAPVCSVVIPSYNGSRWLEPCLSSLQRHRPDQPPIEVIVVDDASSDGTDEFVERRFPWVRLVQNPKNLGFCGAANAGIAVSRGQFIQLLNNDAEVTAGWIEAGLAAFVHEDVGAVAPLVLIRSDPSRVDSAGDCYAFMGWPSKRGHGEPADRWSQRPAEAVFGASGSSAFYRSDLLKRLGGFDPSFGSYYEDVDLSFRLRWAGYRCVYSPECVILHEVSASYNHARPDLQRRMSRNSERIFWSCLPTSWLVLAVLPHLTWTLAQTAARLVRGRARPFVLGKLDALREGPQLLRRRRVHQGLARQARTRPHFPLVVVPGRQLLSHITRPRLGA